MTLRVAVCDDQTLVRAGFRVLIDTTPGLSVVGEAGTGAAAVELIRNLGGPHPHDYRRKDWGDGATG